MTKTNSTYVGQRFQVGQRVKEAKPFGAPRDNFARRVGVVNSIRTKKNKIGREHYYYEVIWEGLKQPTERVQHRLNEVE